MVTNHPDHPIQVNESGNQITIFGYPFGPTIGGSPEEIEKSIQHILNSYTKKLELYIVNPNELDFIGPDVVDKTNTLFIMSDESEAFLLLFGAIVGPIFHGPNRVEEAKKFSKIIRQHLHDYVADNSLF